MPRIIELLIGEFREKKFPALVPREVAFPSLPGKIKVVIGMRRTGKTFLLFQQIQSLISAGVSPERILYVNFEDERLLPMDAKKLSRLIDDYYTLYPHHHEIKCHFFLDEIHAVEDWPVVVRRLLDTGKVDLYLTGSSAKLLSKEIATVLRGRSFPLEVWPFSFQEYLLAHEVPYPKKIMGPAERHKILYHLRRYLKGGGFPEILDVTPSERLTILQDYVNTVVYRDIVDRYGITNISLIKYMIRTLVHSTGCFFSVNKYYNDLKSQGFKVGKNTLHEYLNYIEDAYFAFPVPLFTNSIRKRHSNPRKIYLVDTGMVVANSFKVGPDDGHLFENLIYVDLRRKKYDVFYYLTRSGFEVDFVARNVDGKSRLIQVCSDTADKETRVREKRALDEAARELRMKGEIVTFDNYLEFLDGL